MAHSMKGSMALVLAAGKGTRMKSDLPKVLVPVNGRPMIEYVLDALGAAGIERIVVVIGYRAELVRETLAGRNLTFVEQREQHGTGHAVMMCRDVLADQAGPVLIVTGDSPMLQSDSLGRLFEEFSRGEPACILGTSRKDDPAGLGRIVRDGQGRFRAIVEERDATPDQRQIREVNMSCYIFRGPELVHALAKIRNDNAQREYYITDCPGVLVAEGKDVRACGMLKSCESLSINTVDELKVVEEVLRGGRFE